MTREEAIKEIWKQMDLYKWQAEDINKHVNPRLYKEYETAIQAFEMAINYLSAIEDIKAEIKEVEK